MRCDLSQAGNPNIGLSPKPLPFWNRNTAGELGRCHGCWCYGYFRSQAISIHDIDRENIDRLQNEVVFYNRKGFNYLYHYIIGKCQKMQAYFYIPETNSARRESTYFMLYFSPTMSMYITPFRFQYDQLSVYRLTCLGGFDYFICLDNGLSPDWPLSLPKPILIINTVNVCSLDVCLSVSSFCSMNCLKIKI